jgi:UDP-N-acetylmuramate: L-alanyl-gamma-D-glutamyl-meso-diaminopimelate ligase
LIAESCADPHFMTKVSVPAAAAGFSRIARPRVHFIGICGKAMGGIATALAREGWKITGSDEQCYEPMVGYLQECGISIRSPYGPENVPRDVELVVVGKRVPRTNAELRHVQEQGIRHVSFPQFLREYFLGASHNAVVAGGVGKTTTTALLAWILEHAGLAPDYLLGGRAGNFGASARLAGAAHAVLEGDEYAACFDDMQPKFLHYRPEVGVITNIVEDHPDIYTSMEELCGVFRQFIATIPAHGRLICPVQDANCLALATQAACEVVTTGFSATATAPIVDATFLPEGSSFRLRDTQFSVPLCGRMNVLNAAMAVLAAEHFGISPQRSAEALTLFRGVRNRQEAHEMEGKTLVTDKATHPMALTELAHALRQRFPRRRLVSVIQPRATGGRNWIYQRDLPQALSHYDHIVMVKPYEHNPQHPQPWHEHPFSLDMLTDALAARGVPVTSTQNPEQLGAAIRSVVRSGDVLVLTLPEQAGILAQKARTALEARC